MTSFNIAIDTSNFKPFDFSTALGVLDRYKDAYNAQEKKLEEMQDEWGDIELPEDSKYANTLNDYKAEAEALAADFSKGLNLRNSEWASKLRTRHKKEIKPIKKMVDNYNKYKDTWENIQKSDPYAIQGFNYTVDDFYGGNRPDLGYRNGLQITKDAATYFTGINNALAQDPTFKSVVGGQYQLMINKPGVTPQQALEMALSSYVQAGGTDEATANDFLKHAKMLFDAQNVGNFTEEAKNQVWNRIIQGFIGSIAAPTYTPMSDRSYTDANVIYQSNHSSSNSASTTKLSPEILNLPGCPYNKDGTEKENGIITRDIKFQGYDEKDTNIQPTSIYENVKDLELNEANIPDTILKPIQQQITTRGYDATVKAYTKNGAIVKIEISYHKYMQPADFKARYPDIFKDDDTGNNSEDGQGEYQTTFAHPKPSELIVGNDTVMSAVRDTTTDEEPDFPVAPKR